MLAFTIFAAAFGSVEKALSPMTVFSSLVQMSATGAKSALNPYLERYEPMKKEFSKAFFSVPVSRAGGRLSMPKFSFFAMRATRPPSSSMETINGIFEAALKSSMSFFVCSAVSMFFPKRMMVPAGY